MNIKRSTPKPTSPALGSETPVERATPVPTAASTAMNLGGPVAQEAATPGEDLLAEFTPGLRSAAKLEGRSITIKMDTTGVYGSVEVTLTPDLADLIRKQGEALRAMQESLRVDFFHSFESSPEFYLDGTPEVTQLVVSNGSAGTEFWWEGSIKHSDERFETPMLILEEVLKGSDSQDLRKDPDEDDG